MKIIPPSVVLTLATVAFSVPAASAANYYLQADMGGTADLSNPALYNSAANGSGSTATDMAGNDFFSNGRVARFQSANLANAATFTGNSFTLNSLGQLKVTHASGYTVGNLIISGTAGLLANAGGPNNVLTAANLSMTSGSTLGFAHLNLTNSHLDMRIGTLTGSGNLVIGSAVSTYASITGNTVLLSATDAGAYTGTLSWGSATNQNVVLDFNSTFASAGSLIARANDRINLDQNLTFSSVTIAGTTLTAGTYSFATLNSTFDAVFVDGGSGSITVGAIPEPSTYAAVSGAAVLGLALWRRRPKA